MTIILVGFFSENGNEVRYYLDAGWILLWPGWLAGVTGPLAELSAQSDPAGFTTVINVPPTTIGDDGSIGSLPRQNRWL